MNCTFILISPRSSKDGNPPLKKIKLIVVLGIKKWRSCCSPGYFHFLGHVLILVGETKGCPGETGGGGGGGLAAIVSCEQGGQFCISSGQYSG